MSKLRVAARREVVWATAFSTGITAREQSPAIAVVARSLAANRLNPGI
jgi:hypothetical protein